MALEDFDRPHLLPQGTRTREGFTAHGGGGSTDVPALERQSHASALRSQLAQIALAQQQRVAEQQAAEVQTAIGIQVEFLSQRANQLGFITCLGSAALGMNILTSRR
jgi:hypothetical protein